MKFKLTTSGWRYSTPEMEALKPLGFRFDRIFYSGNYGIDRMAKPTVEFKTLEEFAAFVKEWGPLVIDGDIIEIYDDHRE